MGPAYAVIDTVEDPLRCAKARRSDNLDCLFRQERVALIPFINGCKNVVQRVPDIGRADFGVSGVIGIQQLPGNLGREPRNCGIGPKGP